MSDAHAQVALPPAASWAPPLLPLNPDAKIDRRVRLGAGIGLWLGLLLVTYWWVADGGVTDLAHWDSGLTSLGRLTGLWAADLLLVQVLLMSRLPPLEQAFGRDRLGRIHRVVGFSSFYLMISHIVLIISGYASGQWSAVLSTTWDLIINYGGVVLAVAGTGCLIMVVVTSLKAARQRLRYESWHLLHLYGYLGVGLALPHQLWTGQEFLQSPAATFYWWTLWAVAAGAVIVWRIWLPLWRSARYRLRVVGVVRESSDVFSVYLSGDRLDRLRLRAGQFINVRFLSRPGWTRANPFSLSIAPNGHTMRITAKVLGEGSARLAYLRPGTRVLFEGPYGRLSGRARTQRKVVLAGAGVAEPLFTRELELLAAEKGLQVVQLPGPRRTPSSVLGPAVHGMPELIALRRWIPDLAERDAFLCGPSDWIAGLERLLVAAGVPAHRVHTESFGW